MTTPLPQRLQFPALPPPVGPYAHAVRHGDTVHFSGLTAPGADAGAQARAILSRLGACLAPGAGFAALVKVTVFIVDADDLPTIRAALADACDCAPPASSLVRVAGLFDPAARIEIEAIVAASAVAPSLAFPRLPSPQEHAP